MKSLPVEPAIDTAVDAAVSRILTRTTAIGGSFEHLGGAVRRATLGGKRLRPALVIAAFRAFSDLPPPRVAYEVAAAFELLHAAFVIHDDVIDHDTMRRGIPNVSGEFRARGTLSGADDTGAALLGDAAAILAGDLLLHEATRMIALADVTAHARDQLFALLDDAVFVSAAGELADVENSVTPNDADVSAVLAATFQKTAVYTFSAPLQAGAVLAGAERDAVAVLDAAGGSLGLAFQLVDDLIGAFGTPEQAGRDAGVDLREAKRTPLIAHARQTPVWPRVHAALAVAHTGPVAVLQAQTALVDSGARDGVLSMVDSALGSARARAQDATLPSSACDLIHSLADDISGRVP